MSAMAPLAKKAWHSEKRHHRWLGSQPIQGSRRRLKATRGDGTQRDCSRLRFGHIAIRTERTTIDRESAHSPGPQLPPQERSHSLVSGHRRVRSHSARLWPMSRTLRIASVSADWAKALSAPSRSTPSWHAWLSASMTAGLPSRPPVRDRTCGPVTHGRAHRLASSCQLGAAPRGVTDLGGRDEEPRVHRP